MFRVCSVSFTLVPDCSTPVGRKTTGEGDEHAGSLSESAALTNDLSGEVYVYIHLLGNNCNPPDMASLSDCLHAAARLAVLPTCNTFAG